MTTSLPRPRTRYGRSARPREADERPQLERVVHRREQVGRTADPHRREPRQRFVARRLDADPALDLRPDGDRIEGGRSGTVPGSRRGPRERRRRRPPVGPGRSRRRRPGRGRPRPRRLPGRPSARAAADIARWPGRIVQQRGRVEQRRGVEGLVLDEPRRAGLDEHAGVGPLVPGRVRVRDDDHRQAEGGRPRRGWTSRPVRRPGPRRPARSASRRAGTGTVGSDRGRPPGNDSRSGQGAGVARRRR